MNSTTEKPVRPERLLVDKTEITTFPFIRCDRIGSQLYLFAGPHYQATAKVGYIFDAKSDGELVKFHDLPFISHTCPTIMAAHGKLYHLATPKNDRDGEPMPFEVYDHSTKSWDPLPPLPQSIPLEDVLRLRSLGHLYFGFIMVLFDAKSSTWHHVDVAQQKLEEECFPWDGKAVVVGNNIYALGFEPGIISFSIEKSGSEEDGTLMYSLTSPYKLEGLELHRDPHCPYFDDMFQCWAPFGDFEFCLVQTMEHPSPTFIPLFITTFKIVQKEGTSSRIETLRSSLQFMSTEYGQFWPMFCYNPDYELKQVMLATSKEDTRNRIVDISTSICYLIGMLSNYLSIRDIKPKEAGLTNRKENGQKEICGIKSPLLHGEVLHAVL